jgi:MGT family glycosyltransferase
MRVLFYNVKGVGHVNPTLPLVRALVAGGHEVIYTVSREWRKRLEEMGASYRNTGGELEAPFTTQDYHPSAPFHRQLLPAAAALAERLVQDARRLRPDLVVYDSCAPWGLVVATALGCPSVCSVSTLLFDREQGLRELGDPTAPHDALNREALATLATRWNVDLRAHAPGCFYAEDNLVYSCEELNPPRASIPGRAHFVGPLLATAERSAELTEHGLAAFHRVADGRKRIYVSMGTVLGGPHALGADFFAPFLEALGDRDDYEVLLSVGPVIAESPGPLPRNVTMRPSVPQVAALQHADVFVTHAGANSVHEGLFHGVPLVCMPRFGDQPENSRRVVAAGAGVMLPIVEISAARVGAAVSRVLGDASYAENARRLGQRLRSGGGLDGAMRVLAEVRAARSA